MTFPKYLKYPDGKTYVKITNAEHWEELKWMFGKWILHKFEVSTHVDRLYVQDLLEHLKDGLLVEVAEDEYLGVARS